MLGTIMEFSLLVLSGARRMGFLFSRRESEAVMHLWRWVGQISGVDPWLLEHLTTEAHGVRLAETAEVSAAVLRLCNSPIDAEKLETQAKAIRDSMSETLGGATANEKLAGVLRRSGREDEAEELEVKARIIRDRIATEAARARQAGGRLGFGPP
jgi:hypothetical protein